MKWLSGVPSGRLALTIVFFVFSFYHCSLSMIFIINKLLTRTKIVPSKRQVPKPIKLLEGIRNGALIWSTAIL